MSRLKLEDVEYRQFRISDIFEIENCNCSKVSGIEKGLIPYVGASNRNNGVLSFIHPKKDLITKGNCIAFICDGEGSVGYSVYKSEDFVGSTTVKVGRNPKLNKYNGLFITTVADTVRGKYNFGYKRNDANLKAEILQLPSDSQENPNWRFMEDYIKQEQKNQAAKIIDYYEHRMIKSGAELLGLNDVEWKEFYIAVYLEKIEYNLDGINIHWDEFWLEDIVEIHSGVRLTKADQILGEYPFIGSTDGNNGVTAFISNINQSLDKNTLGVNYNGSVVDNFYHPYECLFSDDVKRMHFKDKSARNKYCYLFLKQSILMQKTKYAYGYKFNANRMKRQKIMLPVRSKGEIDYDFMKKYMLIQEIKEANKIIDYYVKRIQM